MVIAAQVSLYPLRQSHFSPAIGKALEIFRSRGLNVDMGPMSTILSGEDEVIFAALREAFTFLAENSELVMLVTFSNACPVGK